jgi:hypothetical protein
MGTSFRWLVGSAWAGNLGDGIGLAAGPLLVATQTSDPLLVAMAGLLQRLPWLLFGLYAGVLADRIDRRLLVIAVDLVRAGVLVVLTTALVTDHVNVTVVLITMFLLGTAEVFVDTTTNTLLPMLVDKRDLGIGNARLMTAGITMNQLVGPALGAVLFAAGTALPFVVQALCLAFGAVLISRMVVPPLVRPAGPSHLGRDIAEGFRWTWGNGAVRTLTVTIVLFNVTYGAAWSVLVLYATQTLDMGPIGFGLLTTVEPDAVTTTPWVAMTILFVFGAHAFIWGTTSRTVRMRAVPAELQGRVGSLYSIGVFGGIVAGQAVGGVVAKVWGITGPFWFAFVGSAVILVLIWRQLAHIAHADEEALAR